MNQQDKVTLIADLLERIHAPGNDSCLESLRELLTLSGECNQIDWKITANGLKEYIHRLFSKIHVQAVQDLKDLQTSNGEIR